MAKAIDPVCGMQLDPGQIEAQTTYKGKEYDFCSEECRRIFLENPEEHIGATSTDAQGTVPPIPR